MADPRPLLGRTSESPTAPHDAQTCVSPPSNTELKIRLSLGGSDKAPGHQARRRRERPNGNINSTVPIIQMQF